MSLKDKLPDEDWAFEHWFPFDEVTLYALLKTDRTAIRSYLRPKQRTIAQIGRKRGLSLRTLVARLISPWRGRVSANRYRTLRSRTVLVLTNNFVARHLFGHSAHSRTINAALPRILGVPTFEVGRRYASGESWVDIGMSRGRSAKFIRRELMKVVRASARRGIRLKETSARQGWRQARQQTRELWPVATRGRHPAEHHH